MDQTFDNYITDAESKEIVEELKDLTYDPGASFSPLILHGKSGVGKTHLCEAIRQEWENTVIYPAEEIKARIIKVLSNEITEEEFFALFSNHHVIMDDAQQFMFLTEVVDFGWNTVYFHWDAVQDLIAKFIINQRENGFYVILVFDDSFNKNRLNQNMRFVLPYGEVLHVPEPDRDTRTRYCKEAFHRHNINFSDEEAEIFVDAWGPTIPRINAAIRAVLAKRQFRTGMEE